jgi:hypothetical protein
MVEKMKHPKFLDSNEIVARGVLRPKGHTPLEPRTASEAKPFPRSCGRCGEHAAPPPF